MAWWLSHLVHGVQLLYLSEGERVTVYVSAVLAVMYGIAGYVRARMISAWPEMRPWYHLSVLCCAASSASFVWVLIDGDSPGRLLFVRVIQVVSVPVIYIWPAVIGRSIKIAQDRKIAEQLAGQ